LPGRTPSPIAERHPGVKTFSFGYRFKGTGSGSCNLFFYGGSGSCNGTQLGSETFLGEASGTVWVQPAGSVTSPANTTHVYVVCSGVIGGGNYDQFFLSTSSKGGGSF